MPNYKALNENLNIEKKNVLSKQKKTYGDIIYYNELVVFLNDFNTFANIKDFSVYFINNIKHFFNNNVSTEDKLLPTTRETRSFFLYHIATGGSGSIFKYNGIVLKIVSRKIDIPPEYNVPLNLIDLIDSTLINNLSSFILKPISCTICNNLSQFWNIIRNVFEYTIWCIALFLSRSSQLSVEEEYEKVSKNIISYKNIFSNNKKFAVEVMAVFDSVFKLKINIMNNFTEIGRYIQSIDLNNYNEKLKYGYLLFMPIGICSGNKITSKMNYFKNMTHPNIKDLSCQLLFQVFYFYYVITGLLENFVHGDLKLDNIIMFPLYNTLMLTSEINDIVYDIKIESPVCFKLNDFELSSLKSYNSHWSQDLHYFIHSVIFYENLVIPNKLIEKFVPINCSKNCYESWRCSINNLSRKDLGVIITTFFKKFLTIRL